MHLTLAREHGTHPRPSPARPGPTQNTDLFPQREQLGKIGERLHAGGPERRVWIAPVLGVQFAHAGLPKQTFPLDEHSRPHPEVLGQQFPAARLHGREPD